MTTYCSCIICQKQFSNKGLFVHFERSHGTDQQKSKYSNGNNGSYHLITERSIEKRRLLEIEYNQNPKHCLECGTVIPFGRGKNENKFCNQLCSAKYNMRKRSESGWSQSDYQKRRASETAKNRNSVSPLPHTKIKFKICNQCNISYTYPKPNSTPSFCSKECRSKHYSIAASASSRNNPNCGGKRNSFRISYIDSFGSACTLDSTYEFRFANILDKLQINWIRPKHLWYIGQDNLKHRYHPDFFLPDYNIYFDPKNDYLIQQDEWKINQVQNENGVRVVVVSETNLTSDFVTSTITC